MELPNANQAAPERVKNPEIEKVYTYHAPQGTQPTRYAQIREHAKDLAYFIHEHCPVSRERSLALTHLQEVVMWANASIAINE